MSKIETVEQLKEVDKIIVVTGDFVITVDDVKNKWNLYYVWDAVDETVWCGNGTYLDIEDSKFTQLYSDVDHVAEVYTYSDKLFKDLTKIFKQYVKIHKQVDKDREQAIIARLQKEK